MSTVAVLQTPEASLNNLDVLRRLLRVTDVIPQDQYLHLQSSFESVVQALSTLVDFRRVEVTVGGNSYAVWESQPGCFYVLQQQHTSGCDLFALHGQSFIAKLLELAETSQDGFRKTIYERRATNRSVEVRR